MAKNKLVTITQIKKSLQEYTRDEFIELITDMAQACPQARDFLTVKFSSCENVNEMLERYKQKVEHEFFPKRGFGRLNLREAKKAISDFRKICTDKAMGIDIMLFYVENCIDFTSQFGDINESFYDSAINMYGTVIKEINYGDIELYRLFADRLKLAAENACEGWGFQYEMMDLHSQIDWLEELE